jgi:Kef-type K+ transport system membrane component KefB
MLKLSQADRWYVGLIWLIACSFGADRAGLHYMVGAFLSGIFIDAQWLGHDQLDALRRNVLLLLMPVFFLSTGLRTSWTAGGWSVVLAAAALLAVSVSGKLLGTFAAGKLLGWAPGESSLIGWLLQTKALIMIIFANILLDLGIITNSTFTALLLMAITSTMLTMPMVTPMLKRLQLASSRPHW